MGNYGRRNTALAAVITIAVAVSIGAFAFASGARNRIHIEKESAWSIGIYTGISPTALSPAPGIVNPVLTARDVSDVPAQFVADPFMVKKQAVWYLFFEVVNQSSDQGDIGLATSDDGWAWKYQRIVLDEPFHLSHPYVFEWKGRFYMVPESEAGNTVRLYRAEPFPTAWVPVKDLLKGRLSDSNIFFQNGTWWILSCSSPRTHDTLRLFFSDSLEGPYTEHPRSPLYAGNPRLSRSGGRVVSYNGALLRYAQDCRRTYGKAVYALRIDILNNTEYKESPCMETTVVTAAGRGWNRHGMHTVDAHQRADGTWIACVDGYRKYLTVRWEY